MLEKREEWFQEREREALSDDPVTKEAREAYIKALQAAWDNHNPHEGPCYCLWKFMWSPFAIVVAFRADKRVR